MELTVYTCDRCGRETKHPTPITSQPIGLNRDLCTECVDSLRSFLAGRPDPHRQTVIEFETAELQDVYRKGAEALEAWATGATADQLAQSIRDMLSRAKREANGNGHTPNTILGITV